MIRLGRSVPRERLGKLVIWSAILFSIGGLYCGGYVWMRVNHHLVRDATFYTDEGRFVRTDWIRLGEWRYGLGWESLAAIYLPARWAEALYWRSQEGSGA